MNKLEQARFELKMARMERAETKNKLRHIEARIRHLVDLIFKERVNEALLGKAA